MLQDFPDMLKRNNWQDKKIIAAVSGGVDSMVMADLLRGAVKDLVIAHCNFQLRGAESDGDERLVEAWAAGQRIPFYVQRFDTSKLLQQEGGNLQETARELRYQWFEQLRQAIGFDRIAIAQHQQDSVETMLINFFKGTGMAGMHGILPEQGKIIRPLLTLKKETLLQYAQANQVPWREDSSNQKDNYLRNQIRHRILPRLEEDFPGLRDNLAGNSIRFREAEMLYRQALERYRKKLLESRNGDYYIAIRKLRHCRPLATILFELLKPFGFRSSRLPAILQLLEAESGKMIQSAGYRLIRDREFLILTPVATAQSAFIRLEEQPEEERIVFNRGTLLKKILPPDSSRSMEAVQHAGPLEAMLNLEELEFPLLLRPWRTGDYFYPLGMRKKKKLSRFLIDQKIPVHEKEKIWVLESNRKIIWIVGRRIDDRFKIKDPVKPMLFLSFRPQDRK